MTTDAHVTVGAPKSCGRARRKRRAAMYLLVLTTSLIVFAIGASALLAARVQSRTGELDGDYSRARAGAEAAINLGRSLFASDTAWRTNNPNGAWITNRLFDGGAISLYVTDGADNSLSDDIYEPFQMTGVCNRGNARYMLEVTMQQHNEALAALSTAIHAHGAAIVGLFTTLTVSGAPLSSNQGITVLGAVTGSVEASGSVVGLNISGSSTSGVPVKPVPTATQMAVALDPLATSLAYASTFEGGVIARAINNRGSINKHGVYKVTTGNQNMRLRNLRTLATLIIDAGTGTVSIDQQVFMAPWRRDYPTLIILGNAQINLSSPSSLLSETSVGANLNPPGAPYLSITDADTTDSYPNELQGVVYVSGNLTFTGQSVVRGSIIVGGALTVGSLLGGAPTVYYDNTLPVDPPLGFTAVGLPRINPGTWRRVLSPPSGG